MGGSLSVLETPVLASAAGTKNKADSAGAPSAREAASLVPLPCGKRCVLLWGGAELADGEGGEATQLADVCVRIRCCWNEMRGCCHAPGRDAALVVVGYCCTPLGVSFRLTQNRLLLLSAAARRIRLLRLNTRGCTFF